MTARVMGFPLATLLAPRDPRRRGVDPDSGSLPARPLPSGAALRRLFLGRGLRFASEHPVAPKIVADMLQARSASESMGWTPLFALRADWVEPNKGTLKFRASPI